MSNRIKINPSPQRQFPNRISYNKAIDDAIKMVEKHARMKCSRKCLIEDLQKLKK